MVYFICMRYRTFLVMLLWVLPLALMAQQPVWQFTGSQPIIGSPVVHQQYVYFGSLDSNFYCLDAATGTQQWLVHTNGEIRSQPLLADNHIFFLSGDGKLYCIDAKGNIQWTFRTLGEQRYSLFTFADYFNSAPVYDNGIIYFGSGDHHVYAIHAVTGELLWKYATKDIVHTTPCVYGNKVYAGSFDGYLYALNKTNGGLEWTFKSVGQRYFPKGEFNGSPTAYGGSIYVGARDYNFYCIDTATGTCNWNKSFEKGWAITTPLIEDKTLYIGTSDDRLFLALDPATGKEQWRFAAGYNVFGAPVIHDSVIYVGNMMGHLFGINKNTGSKVIDVTTAGYQANRDKYFTTTDAYKPGVFGNIIRRNEDFLQLYIDMGAIISRPALYHQLIIVTAMDGHVYAFRI